MENPMGDILITVGKGLSAQSPPSVGNSNTNNPQAWSRAGNEQSSGSNLFGTRINSPIYFITCGGLAQHMRMKLNGEFVNIQYPILKTFVQVTSQTNTGQTVNDGLRLGVENANGLLRWQEATPFIIQTDWDNIPSGTNNGERMRVTSVGSLVDYAYTSTPVLNNPLNSTQFFKSEYVNESTPLNY
jgi:hypothetical protein